MYFKKFLITKMLGNEIGIFRILLITIHLKAVISFHYDLKIANENHTKIIFAKILKSLVNLNEERISNLRNLYMLNDFDYGKNSLRTFHRVENYDDIVQNMRNILSELHNDHRPPYLFNPYQVHDLNFEHYWRKLGDSDANLKRIKILNDKDLAEDSELLSPELETGRNDYLSIFLRKCNSEDRCLKSCRAALRHACDDYYCYDSFRREMKRQCRKSCERYFD